MKAIYYQIMQELNKGRSVILQLTREDYEGDHHSRIRVVTPNKSEYTNRHGTFSEFTRSCFTITYAGNRMRKLNPSKIIRLMEAYDHDIRLKIDSAVVLETNKRLK